MTFRAGIVGCGRIGSEFAEKNLATHAGAYAAVPEVELVALSDLDEGKLAQAGQRWGITSLYRDYREMLQKESIDILSICTWNSAHLDIAREAINSGVKAIYCEKPIADTLQHADEMIGLCNEKGVILQVNHQRRFDKFYQEVKDFLQKGGLGVIQQASFFYSRGIANTGSHMFDLLRFFFGDAAWVEAHVSQHKSPDPDDPNIDGIVQFSSGLTCEVGAGDDQSITIFNMDFIGNSGKLKINRNGREVQYYTVRDGKLQSEAPPLDPSVSREPMVVAVKHLIDCLQLGRESISSGADGRAALELICAFHQSAGAGSKRVALPLIGGKVGIKSR